MQGVCGGDTDLGNNEILVGLPEVRLTTLEQLETLVARAPAILPFSQLLAGCLVPMPLLPLPLIAFPLHALVSVVHQYAHYN